MKNKLYIITIGIIISLASCTTTSKISKGTAYNNFYSEKPLSVLIMPLINKSTNVEAKEYFHSTLNVPIANAGYYVIPPFLSMEMIKRESAYDAELFIDRPLDKFREVFGADLAVFTIIHKWDKSGLAAKVYIEVEYIIKSTKTNEVIYTRKGDITYNASVSTGAGGTLGALADIAASAINTAATKYVDVARSCNGYTFSDLPAGKYNTSYQNDSTQMAGKKEFKVNLNSNSKY